MAKDKVDERYLTSCDAILSKDGGRVIDRIYVLEP